jgi:tetratricopeptide (TPR) repeat protein
MEFRLTAAAFVAVFATYLFLGGIGVTDRGNPNTRDAAYNLLARGLLSGHLYVDKKVPEALARLPDPYDPDANRTFRDDPRYSLHDLSYFRGRLYLYFGVAPALLVFIPWHLLTGGWLPHWVAVVFLCSAGLLVNLSLLSRIKHGVLSGARPWLMAACVLVLGLASYAPLLVARADMWEIPIAFSYFSVSVALRCLWEAFGDPVHPARWIALASTAIGAAFAARPTALPNAAILLLPFLAPGTRRSGRAWAAAVVPLGVCGAGVALYNFERFGSPFDFGIGEQMAGVYVAHLHAFSPTYLATNLRFYLFQGVRWSPIFPFAHEPALDHLRAGLPVNHGGVEHISGALLNAPVLWAAAFVPAFLRFRGADRRLLPLCAAAAWVALSSLVMLSFFFGACSRYQFEFVPALALLASVGIIGIESEATGRVRGLARCAWIPALAVSSAFPVLYGIERCALDHNYSGISCLMYGDFTGAQREFESARLLSPRNPLSRLGAGMQLALENRPQEALAILKALTRDFPDYAKAHLALGNVLAGERRRDEAIVEFRAAHRLDPGDAAISAALAAALAPKP